MSKFLSLSLSSDHIQSILFVVISTSPKSYIIIRTFVTINSCPIRHTMEKKLLTTTRKSSVPAPSIDRPQNLDVSQILSNQFRI